MNITHENNGELNAIIHIQLSPEDYNEEVTKKLKEYRGKASMPGFRPGKVPMGMIKKMYGKGVVAEEVNKIVSDSLNQYILNEELNVLGYPLPNMEKNTTIDFDKDSEFNFYFDVGLAPEFEVELGEDIKIPYYVVEIDEKEVDNALNDIKMRFGEEENPEKAEETDGFQGTFREVDEAGEVVEGGLEHKGYFKIEDIKLKTVKDNFIGKGAGDVVVFNLMKAFKDESKVRSLLHLHEGSEDKLELDYAFDIEKVVRFHEAELNEELFKKVYPAGDVTTEEAFREKVTEEIGKHRAGDSDKQFLSDAIDELIKLSNLELPDAFMKRWLLESNEGKITADQIDTQYDNYLKTMKWQLIESKLQEKFGDEVRIDHEEIREKIRSYFMPGGDPGEKNPQIEQIVDQVLQNEQEAQRIYAGIQDEKYTRLFKDKLTLEEEKVDSDKFLEIASKSKLV
jgi:trigger factor